MKQTPQYQKSVPIEITSEPNPNSAYQSLINSFEKFSEGLAAVSQHVSVEEAQQRRETIKNNISNTYQQFSLDALKNPDQNAGLSGFYESSKKYAQGLLQQTDQYNKPYVSNLVDYYHNHHQYAIEKNAILQNKRIEQVGAYDRINRATEDVVSSVQNSSPMVDEEGTNVQFDAPKALIADQIKNMEHDVALGLITPARFSEAKKSLITKYTSEVYLKQYQDHVDAGTGNEFIQHLQDRNFDIPGFSIDDKTKLIGKMIHIRDQGKAGAQTAISQLRSQMTDEVVRVQNGGLPNQGLIEQVSALDPKAAENFNRDIDVAEHVFSAKQATQYKSPSEISAYKVAALQHLDVNDPNYGRLREIYDKSVQAIDAQELAIRKDPMEYMIKIPAINDAVNTYLQATNSFSQGEQHLNTPYNSTIPKPYMSIIQAEMNKGLTLNGSGNNRVRLLYNDLASVMVNDITSASPTEKIQKMNEWRDDYGGSLAFNLVVKQLVDAGMPSNYALLAGFDPNSSQAKDIASAFSVSSTELASELNKQDSSLTTAINKTSSYDVFSREKGTDNFRSFLNSTSAYAGQVDREYLNNVAQSVQQLAYYYTLTQGLDPHSAVEKAEDIVAARYNYATINESEIRIPKEVPRGTIISFADKVQPEMDKFKWDLKGFDKDYARQLIEQGHWKNDAVDYGVVWVDANGKLWTDADGHPFGFSFEEAKTGIRSPLVPDHLPLNEIQEEEINDGQTVGK